MGSGRERSAVLALASVIGLLAAPVAVAGGADRAHAAAPIEQPPQPKSGPGGSGYTHGYRVHSGGTGPDAWYVFEPTKPTPRKAPVTVIMHGYYEFQGYASMRALIRHTVRKGSIVIYPRWQTNIATPCPGPIDIEPCIDSAVRGIKGALAYLRSGHNRVRPRVKKASYFGFSFGGIVTANLATRYRALHLPKPRAIFLDDPHDGGLTGNDEPALDDDLGGIPSSTLFQCHSGQDGVISGTTDKGESQVDGSCNSVFPKLTSIPAKNKDLVLTHTHSRGKPTLSSSHGVCASGSDPGGGRLWTGQRLRLELLLEGLGRAAQLRARGPLLPLRTRQHAPTPLQRQVERRCAGHRADDSGRGADPPLIEC